MKNTTKEEDEDPQLKQKQLNEDDTKWMEEVLSLTERIEQLYFSTPRISSRFLHQWYNQVQVPSPGFQPRQLMSPYVFEAVQILETQRVPEELIVSTTSFRFLLKVPLKYSISNKTNRMFQRYGSDRFLKVTIPLINCKLSSSWDNFLHENRSLTMLSRQYRWLHIKGSSNRHLVVYFFAEKSNDPLDHLAEISVDQVRRWHIPILENPTLSLSKYVSRFDLGFSSTWRTVPVPSSELNFPPDIVSKNQIFSDGCSAISIELMESIVPHITYTNKYGRHFPSAIQGRIGPYKGVWYIDPKLKGRQLHIRPSMKKYTLNNPDDTQQTLEVRQYSSYRGPSRLNRQILILLDSLLESREALISMQSQELKKMEQILDSPERAQQFLETHPDLPQTQIALNMMEAGLWNEPYLKQILMEARKTRVDSILRKSHITVPKSGRFLLVADHSGLLRSGEVYLRVSDPAIGVITGDVIVTRNPCYHPGDIRKLRAVGLPDLYADVLLDVIILSSQGDRPVANMMSGGDYDGDEGWICWDTSLVREFFQHDPASHTIDKIDDESCRKRKKNISRAFKNNKLPTSKVLITTIRQNLRSQQLLGTLSNWHLLRADWSPEGVFDIGCLEMAEMLSNLVDAGKTGYVGSLPLEFREKKFPKWWINSSSAQYNEQRKSRLDHLSSRPSNSIIARLHSEAYKQIQSGLSRLRTYEAQRQQPLKSLVDLAEKMNYRQVKNLADEAYEEYEKTTFNIYAKTTDPVMRSLLFNQCKVEHQTRFRKDAARVGKHELALAYYMTAWSKYDDKWFKHGHRTKVSSFFWDCCGDILCALHQSSGTS